MRRTKRNDDDFYDGPLARFGKVDWPALFTSRAIPSDAKIMLYAASRLALTLRSAISIDEVAASCGMQPSAALPLITRLVECGALEHPKRTRRHNGIDEVGDVQPGPRLLDRLWLERYFSRAHASGSGAIVVNAGGDAAVRNRPRVDYCNGERSTFVTVGTVDDTEDPIDD